MKELTLLRQLAENQKYPTLLELAQSLWHNSHNPAILPLLAIANAHMGFKENAQALYHQSIENFEELDCDARCDLAAVLIVMLRTDEAIEMLNHVLVEQNKHPLALARLGYCYLICGSLAEAQDYFQRSLEIVPQRLAVHRNLITIYMAKNELCQAQNQLDSAIQVLSNKQHALDHELYQQYWLQLYTTQLQLWVTQGLFAPAEEWLTQLGLQQQAGNCEEALLVHCVKSYSQLLAENDLHHQAADILREFLKRYSNNPALSSSLAELAQLQGHYMQAITLLQKALNNDMENSTLLVQLSSACLQRFDEKARKTAERGPHLQDISLQDTLLQEIFLQDDPLQECCLQDPTLQDK